MAWSRLTEGITFRPLTGSNYDMHSYTTFGLILESDDVGFPDVSSFADSWDVLYDYPTMDFKKKTYGRRSMVFNFGCKVSSRWPDLVSNVTKAIHGQKMCIIRDCEDDWYYIGRCIVNAYKTTRRIGKIQVQVNAEPFKYKLDETVVTVNYSSSSANIYYFNCNSHFNAPVSANITLTGAADYITLQLNRISPYNNFCEVRVDDLSGSRLTIDGVRKRITEGSSTSIDKMADCSILSGFPYLIPGGNRLSVLPVTSPAEWSSIIFSYRERRI